MHELKRTAGRTKRGKHHRKVVVCPPTEQQIEQYARAVCQQLSQKHHPAYGAPEVVRGFTDFVKLAVRIRARQLGATYDEQEIKERAA